ncbi:hypothetical protein [Nocardia arizonensis]|uniref:hypothetical protein n=1 Tax=Nocardia arizonensis TaxID=1141647 RepID=UPI0012E20201|nr:hypothetical protein [Nocardia arizonensis]
MTTRTTITMDDALFAMVRDAAGSNVSDWIAKACRSRLLAEDARALAAWQRTHPGETADAYAEAEAEREARDRADEEAARRRGDAA